jgi:hypothetical protein
MTIEVSLGFNKNGIHKNSQHYVIQKNEALQAKKKWLSFIGKVKKINIIARGNIHFHPAADMRH